MGDIDNAVVSLEFASGTLGVVDLTRNGIYGYDITTELLGTEGTLRVGYLRETPLMVMTKNAVTHDTVPYFMERFRDAYTVQLQNFADNVLQGRQPRSRWTTASRRCASRWRRRGPARPGSRSTWRRLPPEQRDAVCRGDPGRRGAAPDRRGGCWRLAAASLPAGEGP